jgi:hypothetical protein
MSVSSDQLDLPNDPAAAYQELAGTVSNLQDEVAELHGELAEKEARIDALQRKFDYEQKVRESLFGTLGDVELTEADLDDLLLAGEPVGMKLDQREREQRATEQYVFGECLGGTSVIEAHVDDHGTLPSRLDDLDEAIREEEHNRGIQDAKLRRRMAAVEEAADVEVTDEDLKEDDKITRVRKHGVRDVESNPSKTAKRAATLLQNIETWAVLSDDVKGRRATITNPDAREHLEAARDEDTSLQSSQVTRVFEKIVREWAADSPRAASIGSSGRTKKLSLGIGGVDTE